MKRTKITNGIYTTYEDMQSLEETHDMLVHALPGQSYILDQMHKVSTTQVTGEALKKVSVGGKGGFGSQGDARDQEKQVLVTSRVMVMADPIQRVFDHNASLDKICVGFDEDGKAIYIKQGESITYTKNVPSHLFGAPIVSKETRQRLDGSEYTVGVKEMKGEVEFTKSHGRDYWEFSHSNNLDASDRHSAVEFMNAHSKLLGLPFNIDMDRARNLYDELCGYKDAWKYVGHDGAEHRRYTIKIVNTLNLDEKNNKKPAYVPKNGQMNWESSSYNHHVVGPNYELYYDSNNGNVRKDCIEFVLMQLKDVPNNTEEFISNDGKRIVWVKPSHSKVFEHNKGIAEEFQRKKRLESLKNAPKLSDWRMVYNWELTKQGKIMFSNEKI